MQLQDCALHYSTSRGKIETNTCIADIIGIADIVLLSTLSIDPALDNTHPHGDPRRTWNYNTNKKLSYRRETARQLHTSFSAHSLIVHFIEHHICFTTI